MGSSVSAGLVSPISRKTFVKLIVGGIVGEIPREWRSKRRDRRNGVQEYK